MGRFGVRIGQHGFRASFPTGRRSLLFRTRVRCFGERIYLRCYLSHVLRMASLPYLPQMSGGSVDGKARFAGSVLLSFDDWHFARLEAPR